MAIYPGAEQRIWKSYDPERAITPRVVILHTNAVNSEDPGSQGGLSWHFQVGRSGAVYQHRDTGTRAAANADANDFAISIETWDGGDPEGNPWSSAQLDAIVALVGWCCDTHAIPRTQVDRWDGSGVGFHRMFSQWNNPVHSCPGNTRAQQFADVVLPRLQQGADDLTPEEHTQLNNIRTDVDSLHVKIDQLTALVTKQGQGSGGLPSGEVPVTGTLKLG